jgi:hypothetical protein
MYTSKKANVRVLIPSLVALVFAGCGGALRRKEGTEDLTRIQDAVQGLHILVSAGLTKAEYSQRLEDMLLKVGDLNGSQNQTVPKFPQKDQGTVREIYTHLSKSIDAYKTARDYFGDKSNGPGCEDGCMTISQHDYETEKATFPTLIQLQPVKAYADWYPNSPASYFRNDMLQALWKIAADEDTSAKALLEKMKQQ